MTREDIIRMAREAHLELVTQDYPGHAGQLDPWTVRLLERFAALVAAAEREKIAQSWDALHNKYMADPLRRHMMLSYEMVANLIRGKE